MPEHLSSAEYLKMIDLWIQTDKIMQDYMLLQNTNVQTIHALVLEHVIYETELHLEDLYATVPGIAKPFER